MKGRFTQVQMLPALPMLQILISLLFVTTTRGHGDHENAWHTSTMFLSRPDLNTPPLTIDLKQPGFDSPGFLFVAPWGRGLSETKDVGPFIFDNNGSLVWSAGGRFTESHDFHVCTYETTDHLCFFEGNAGVGYRAGHGVIVDNHYNPVANVHSGKGRTASDMHEFKVLDGKTALVTIFENRQYHDSIHTAPSPWSWVLDGVVQEIDIATKEVLFEWTALDHVHPGIREHDYSEDDPKFSWLWDYFHINSLDKNDDGDYLISSRRLFTVFKISGRDGSIIWQLGGSNSSFVLEDFTFSWQHHVRFVSENATTTILSMFDNGSDGQEPEANTSAGLLIVIDHTTMTSRLLYKYEAPNGGMLSISQGSMQVLPSRNVLVGWGSHGVITEHQQDGTPIFLATFPEGFQNYRAYRSNWVGQPLEPPALWSFSKDAQSQTVWYVSWNGATEVAYWNFYAKLDNTPDTTFILLGHAAKNGFETMFSYKGHFLWTIAEAVDKNGNALRNSSTTRTFVPGSRLAQSCNEFYCSLPRPHLPKSAYEAKPLESSHPGTDIKPVTDDQDTGIIISYAWSVKQWTIAILVFFTMMSIVYWRIPARAKVKQVSLPVSQTAN